VFGDASSQNNRTLKELAATPQHKTPQMVPRSGCSSDPYGLSPYGLSPGERADLAEIKAEVRNNFAMVIQKAWKRRAVFKHAEKGVVRIQRVWRKHAAQRSARAQGMPPSTTGAQRSDTVLPLSDVRGGRGTTLGGEPRAARFPNADLLGPDSHGHAAHSCSAGEASLAAAARSAVDQYGSSPAMEDASFLNPLPRQELVVRWVPDCCVTNCTGCGSTFGWLWPRKHHCRGCGNIFCGGPMCAPDYFQMPVPGYQSTQRVCLGCLHRGQQRQRYTQRKTNNSAIF
jgi:hypothetical protein